LRGSRRRRRTSRRPDVRPGPSARNLPMEVYSLSAYTAVMKLGRETRPLAEALVDERVIARTRLAGQLADAIVVALTKFTCSGARRAEVEALP